MLSLTLGAHTIHIHMPERPADCIVYLHASVDEGLAVWQLLTEPKPVLAVVSGTDWNRDFSPWQAQRVFSKGEDFAGGAERYLEILTGRIIPEVEVMLPHPPKMRCIAGYSLAGLFSLWTAFRCDDFDAAAALSPSLWFDGFMDFIACNRPSERLKCLAISLGDREKHTRNVRMAIVEDAVLSTCKSLAAQDIDVRFRFESGGHFDDVTGRIARGISNLFTPGM